MEFELLYNILLGQEKHETTSQYFKTTNSSKLWLADTFNQLPSVADWFYGTQNGTHPLEAYFKELLKDD